MNVTPSQWSYYRHWLILTSVAEIVMLFLNRFLPEIYAVIAVLFAAALVMRVLKIYPGQPEPVRLGFWAVVIACLFCFAARLFGGSVVRFIVIFFSSAIILPHLIYIAREK